jgi:hypothetical protein
MDIKDLLNEVDIEPYEYDCALTHFYYSLLPSSQVQSSNVEKEKDETDNEMDVDGFDPDWSEELEKTYRPFDRDTYTPL